MFKYGPDVFFTPNTSHGKIVEQITEGSAVLEFGCATGYMSGYLKEKKHCRVYGIEIDEEAIKEASQYLEKAICCNVEEGSWADEIAGEKFDYILFADVLEHLKNPHEVLRKAVDFLKADGKIIVSIPNITHSDIIMKMLLNRFEYTGTGLLDNTHIHFWGSKGLKEFFDSCGLTMASLDGTVMPMGTTEQKCTDINKDLAKIIGSKAYGNIYQFICVLYKKEYAEDHKISFKSLIGDDSPDSMYHTLRSERLSELQTANVFFDMGKGYNEYDRIAFEYTGGSLQSVRITIPSGCVSVRFDPCEGNYLIVHKLTAMTDAGEAALAPLNGFCCGDITFFSTTDPQYAVSIPPKAKWIEFGGTVTNIISHELYETVDKLIKTIGTEQQNTENKLAEVTAEKDRLYNELKEASENKLAEITAEKDRLYNELKEASENKLAEITAEKDGLYNELREENKKRMSAVTSDVNIMKNELFSRMDSVIINQNKQYSVLMEYNNRERAELISQRDEARNMYEAIKNSTCWKLTAPIRWISNIFRRK